MNKRRLWMSVLFMSMPALAVAVSPQADTFGTPMPDQELDQYRGAQDMTFNLQDTEAELYNNRALNTISGANALTGQAFSDASGVSTVIQNSGNNVIIQNATIINVKLQ